MIKKLLCIYINLKYNLYQWTWIYDSKGGRPHRLLYDYLSLILNNKSTTQNHIYFYLKSIITI